MFSYLFQDFRANNFSIFKSLVHILIDRGYSAVFLYRLSSWCWLHKLKSLSILFKQLNILLNSCDIASQAEIGKGFKIYHALGVVITNCKIGENFSIYQNVTVGNNIKPNKSRTAPIIGSNVSLLVGCVVVGPITIGDNVKVGANAVVLDDVPSFSTAVGVPARIVQRNQLSLPKE
jgi:serine O-acetyltransferase